MILSQGYLCSVPFLKPVIMSTKVNTRGRSHFLTLRPADILVHNNSKRREKQNWQFSEIFLFDSKSLHLVIVPAIKLYIHSHTSVWFHRVILLHLLVWAKPLSTMKTSCWGLTTYLWWSASAYPPQGMVTLSLWISDHLSKAGFSSFLDCTRTQTTLLRKQSSF